VSTEGVSKLGSVVGISERHCESNYIMMVSRCERVVSEKTNARDSIFGECDIVFGQVGQSIVK